MILQAMKEGEVVYTPVFWVTGMRLDAYYLLGDIPKAKVKKDGEPHQSALNQKVALRPVSRKYGYEQKRRENLFATREEAVAHIIQRIDEDAAKRRAEAKALL